MTQFIKLIGLDIVARSLAHGTISINNICILKYFPLYGTY